MSTANNEPAFPVQDASKWQCHGMTLRDYFAGQVICGLMARHGVPDASYESALAYAVADAMLKAREVTA